MKKYGGSESIGPPFLISSLDVGQWSVSRPYRFTPKETSSSTQMGLGAGLDIVEKRKFLAHNRNWTPIPQS
jgi:hypothetical protein